MPQHNIADVSPTLSDRGLALFQFLEPHLEAAVVPTVRETVGVLTDEQLATVPAPDWDKLRSDEPLSVRGTEALHSLVSTVLGGHPRQHDPDHEAAVKRAEGPVVTFSRVFADVASLVPTPMPLMSRVTNGVPTATTPPSTGDGQGKGISAVCASLPNIPKSQAEALHSSRSLQAIAPTQPALATTLASVGLTPIEFRDASRAVAALVLRTLAGGADADVVLQADGRFTEAWPGGPLDAVSAVEAATELPRASAEAVLLWLVAAAELAPAHSLFPMLRTTGTEGGVQFALEPGPQPDDADAPSNMWRRFLEAAEEQAHRKTPAPRRAVGPPTIEAEASSNDANAAALGLPGHKKPRRRKSRRRREHHAE